MALRDRVKNAWSAFTNRDPTPVYREYGSGYGIRPDRPRLSRGNEKTIVTSVYNRIAMDAATVNVRHVRLDELDRFTGYVNSSLNECLTLDANIDQTGRALIQDIVLTMLDEGVVAVVPTWTDVNPNMNDSFKIYALRTAKILEWYPRHVKLELYNEVKGKRQEIVMSKDAVCIIPNPLYAVINEPNSTMQRLISKLRLLDVADEQMGAGKIDMIIQLPYTIRTEARRAEAERRRNDIELQLSSSKYGIAYADATEHITQLNRSVDNQLQNQVEYLTRMLYGQLGIDETILNGTANEDTMNNYYNRTIEPILSAIVEEMSRKFLTKTARSQKQLIMFFRDPFKLVSLSKIGDLANSLVRNEIVTANEFRQKIGLKPADEEKADELRNPNMPDTDGDGVPDEAPEEGMSEEDYNNRMSELDNLDAQYDEIEEMLGGED